MPRMELTDRAAVDDVLAGKHESFRVLVERHGRKVFGLAFRMTGNEHDADEVVQETFVRAFKGLASMREDTKLSTWLFGIAKNVARESLRSRRRGESHVDIEDAATVVCQH